eukprot:1100871-Pyramimonas_sp.AAC.1
MGGRSREATSTTTTTPLYSFNIPQQDTRWLTLRGSGQGSPKASAMQQPLPPRAYEARLRRPRARLGRADST